MRTRPRPASTLLSAPVLAALTALFAAGHAGAGPLRNLVDVTAIGSAPGIVPGVSGRAPVLRGDRDDVLGSPGSGGFPIDIEPAAIHVTSPTGEVRGDPFSPSDDLPPLTTQFGLFPHLDSGLGHAAGFADTGELRGWAGAAAAYLPGSSPDLHVNASVGAQFAINDLTFKVEPGFPFPSPSVSPSLNLEVDADIIRVLNAIDTVQRGVTTVQVNGRVGRASGAELFTFDAKDSIHKVFSSSGAPVLDLQNYARVGIEGIPDTPELAGRSTLALNEGLFPLLDELPGDVLTTKSFDAPLGEPLDFLLRLELFAEVQPEQRAIVITDFASSVTLPTSGPVFDLPPGITVDSAQANIVDNRWLGGARAPALPEPATLVLIGVGLAAMGGTRKTGPRA